MKETIFTSEEKEFIITNLHNRMLSYKEHGKSKEHEKTIEEIFEKIDSEWDKYYRSKHKRQITSVTNEFLNPYSEKKHEFLNSSSSRFIELTEEDKRHLKLFDLCFGILEKTDNRKSKFRFAHILAKIDRLKNCDKIYLSRINNDSFYRIGFVDNQEILEWEMYYGVNILTDDFCKISKVRATKFTDRLSKEDAKEIIKNCETTGIQEDVMKFTNYLIGLN